MGPGDERAVSPRAGDGPAVPAVPPPGGRACSRAASPGTLAAALLLVAVAAVPPAAAAQQGATSSLEGAVRVEGAPLPIRAEPGLEELARSLATDRRAWAPLPGIGGPDQWFDAPPTVWVVSDLGRVPGPGPEPWAAGFADGRRNLLAVRAGHGAAGGLQGLRSTFRHELAHLALDRATGGQAPRWLHEGYAQIVSGSWNAGQAWRLRWALFRSDGSLLQQMSLRFPEDEQRAQLAYLLSYTAVNELVRRGGSGALRSFFERLREGDDLDAAMRGVYGMTALQFEERWRKTVRGRYGWLYVLSRASVFWFLLTVALLVLGWKRWRHQRERWEELRRKEAAEAARQPAPGTWIRLVGRVVPGEREGPAGSSRGGDPGREPGDRGAAGRGEGDDDPGAGRRR